MFMFLSSNNMKGNRLIQCTYRFVCVMHIFIPDWKIFLSTPNLFTKCEKEEGGYFA